MISIKAKQSSGLKRVTLERYHSIKLFQNWHDASVVFSHDHSPKLYWSCLTMLTCVCRLGSVPVSDGGAPDRRMSASGCFMHNSCLGGQLFKVDKVPVRYTSSDA